MAETVRPVEKAAHYPGSRGAAPVAPMLGVLLVLVLTGCSSGPPPRSESRPIVSDYRPADPFRANNVLMRALGLVGTPYRWGGNTPESGFDCSGLVGFVFRDAAGLSLPRSTGELARLRAHEPSRQQLAPGDLLLFGNGRGVNHVGIYVGEGRFVHAPNEGGTVRLDLLSGHYWRDSYLGAKRLLD